MVKRIGVLSLPLRGNYGGMLQTVALCRKLQEMGKDVTFLNQARRVRPLWKRLVLDAVARIPLQDYRGFRSWRRLDQAHEPFLRAQLPQRSPLLHDHAALQRAAASLEAVIVGSDQVWRAEYAREDGPLDYFLDFVPPGCRRVAYAASFGLSQWTAQELVEAISRLLPKFAAVSLREVSGIGICRETFGYDGARLMPDPTLLFDAAFYREMMAPAGATTAAGPVVLKYVLDKDSRFQGLESRILSALGPGYLTQEIALDSGHKPATVGEWLRAFDMADFVVTDSFHGTVFSILFRKPFLSIVNHDRGADRFTSLLGQLGLEDRLVWDGTAEGLEATVSRPIDYEQIHRVVGKLRREAISFLTESLT